MCGPRYVYIEERKFWEMAEYLVLPPRIKLLVQTSCVKETQCGPHFRSAQRRCSHGRCKVVWLSTPKMYVHGISAVQNQKVYPHLRESSSRCRCLGFLVNPDSATASDWVPIGDQVLLMASIFLTYLAGVIPVQKSNNAFQKNVLDNNMVPESSTPPGSFRKKGEKGNLSCAWEVVQEKLLDSLVAVENGSNFGTRVQKFDQKQAKCPLSLYAISEGPKLRLLWASFQQLEKEVKNISASPDTIKMDDWLTAFAQIIRESFQPACMSWLENEFGLENSNPDEAFISLVVEKSKGDDNVFKNILKSGKGDLYAELVYFLRFGSLRKGCCFENSMFTSNADSILEDLVITLADGIASIYLELISVDGNLSNEINSLSSVICNLSTRALQRLRNEVALNLWLYQNVEAIVSMYEDRFDLRTFQSQLIEESIRDSQTEICSWFKKITRRKPGTQTSAFHYIEIMDISISAKRTKELRALTGWRYYFSLFLELSDISMPFIRAIFEKISNAISFFFVCLIGRSIGLIYTGIRQSLRWK